MRRKYQRTERASMIKIIIKSISYWKLFVIIHISVWCEMFKQTQCLVQSLILSETLSKVTTTRIILWLTWMNAKIIPAAPRLTACARTKLPNSMTQPVWYTFSFWSSLHSLLPTMPNSGLQQDIGRLLSVSLLTIAIQSFGSCTPQHWNWSSSKVWLFNGFSN